jgi:hypothetical protein
MPAGTGSDSAFQPGGAAFSACGRKVPVYDADP